MKDRNKGENEQIIDTNDDDEVTILRVAEYEVQTWELFISSFTILSPHLQFYLLIYNFYLVFNKLDNLEL